MTQILLKRAYQPAEADDGFRVLVDRMWPRGLTHQQVPYDMWAKDIAPTADLIKWYHAGREDRWDEFERRYTAQLQHLPAFASFVSLVRKYPTVTLVYGARDPVHNQATVIADAIRHAL